MTRGKIPGATLQYFTKSFIAGGGGREGAKQKGKWGTEGGT